MYFGCVNNFVLFRFLHVLFMSFFGEHFAFAKLKKLASTFHWFLILDGAPVPSNKWGMPIHHLILDHLQVNM